MPESTWGKVILLIVGLSIGYLVIKGFAGCVRNDFLSKDEQWSRADKTCSVIFDMPKTKKEQDEIIATEGMFTNTATGKAYKKCMSNYRESQGWD